MEASWCFNSAPGVSTAWSTRFTCQASMLSGINVVKPVKLEKVSNAGANAVNKPEKPYMNCRIYVLDRAGKPGSSQQPLPQSMAVKKS